MSDSGHLFHIHPPGKLITRQFQSIVTSLLFRYRPDSGGDYALPYTATFLYEAPHDYRRHGLIQLITREPVPLLLLTLFFFITQYSDTSAKEDNSFRDHIRCRNLR